jgi:hypothetical protein
VTGPATTRTRASRAAASRASARGSHAGRQEQQLTLANHPRAGGQIQRLKGWGGLVGFGVAALLAWRSGIPFPEAALRAIAAGLVGYVAVWAIALNAWRIVIDAERRATLADAEAARAAAGDPHAMAPPPPDPGPAPAPAAPAESPPAHAEQPAGERSRLATEGV